MRKEKINWESFPPEEIARLNDLAEITSQIRLAIAAYIRTPVDKTDKKAFSGEIKGLAKKIETWANEYEGRVKKED